jgi:hypothetical protein
MIHGHNYWYADTSDISAFLSSVNASLQTHILAPTHIDPLSFQLSRSDLFYMHEVPQELKQLVLDALLKMGTGRFNPSRFKNTRYLSCKLIFDKGDDGKPRLSSVVFRFYDKDLEVYNRHHPEAVGEDFGHHRYTEYVPPNYIRLEVSMTRDALVNRLGGKSRQTDNTTLGGLLLHPSKQAELLDSHLHSKGFYDKVLSAPSFREEVDAIAKTDKVRHNAVDTARLLRDGRNPRISPDALRRVKELLQANGLSLVTMGEKGCDLPPIDRAALLAQGATFAKVPTGVTL